MPLDEQPNLTFYELFPEYCSEDEGDDVYSTCSTVYSVGDISIITNESNDVSCIDDIEDDDFNSPMDSGEDDESRVENTDQPLVLEARPSICPGYTLVIDNVDMNIRRSEQGMGRTTKSYHYCHGYAVKNRIDTTSFPDGPPAGVLSIEHVLPNKGDLDKILDEFKVIVSRYHKVATNI